MVRRKWRTAWVLGTAIVWSFSLGEVASAAGNPKAGQAKYLQLCAFCHGATGKGNGPAAQGFPVKPADHTNKAKMRKLKDGDLGKIIKGGGRSVGKSPLMPPFANQLSDADIQNLIAYIRTLAR